MRNDACTHPFPTLHSKDDKTYVGLKHYNMKSSCILMYTVSNSQHGIMQLTFDVCMITTSQSTSPLGFKLTSAVKYSKMAAL